MQSRSPGHAPQRVACCLLIACLAASGSATAVEIHRWVDENGVVHFSDVRPVSVPSETLEFADPPPVTETAGANTDGTVSGAGAEPQASAAEQRRQAIRERRETRAAEREEKEFWCDRHRTRLEQMEPARRVYYNDENGQQVRMDDDMRIGLIEESRRFLSENCQ